MTTWIDAFDAWWKDAKHGWGPEPAGAEHSLAQQAYSAGRDCGRGEMKAVLLKAVREDILPLYVVEQLLNREENKDG